MHRGLFQEEMYLKEYEFFADAEANLEMFIEQVYNTKRLHRKDGEPTPEAVCESSLTGQPGKAAKLRRMNGLWKQGMIMLYDYLSPAVEWTWATYNAC